jgi:hypothetical protein
LIESVFRAGTMAGESRTAYQLATVVRARKGAVE